MLTDEDLVLKYNFLVK